METKREPEVPPDTLRKQIRTIKPVRSYLRHLKSVEGDWRTYSDVALGLIPDEQPPFEHTEEDRVRVKFTPEAHDRIDSVAGETVSPGEVLALFVLLEALRRGDVDAAAAVASVPPEMLCDAYEFAVEQDD